MEIGWAQDQVKLMELLLNLAWLVITLASYAILGWRLACSNTAKARGPSRIQCVIALSCALAILFPVISLTDDLHEMQATLEDASSVRLVIKQCGFSHLHASRRALYSTYVLVPSFAMAVSWTVLGGVATQNVATPSPGVEALTASRAPPLATGQAS